MVTGSIRLNVIEIIDDFAGEPMRRAVAEVTQVEADQASERAERGVQLRSRGVFPINSPDGGPGHRVFYGAYYDEVVKTPAGWRIRSRVFSAQRI